MSKVVRIITSPLSLIDKKLGATVSKIALTAISLMNPVAGLVIAGVQFGMSALAKRPRSPSIAPDAIDRLPASIR